MAAFVIFNSTGAIQGAYTMSHAAQLNAAMAANTPADASALAVDISHPVVTNQSGYQVVNGALTPVVPTAAQLLAQAQASQIAIITQASIVAQTGGFTSNALGSTYTYPSDAQDQANLTAVVTASVIAPAGTTFAFLCTDANNVTAFVSHTATQIQAVGMAALTAIMAAKSKQATLIAQIQAATTVAAVQAIAW